MFPLAAGKTVGARQSHWTLAAKKLKPPFAVALAWLLWRSPVMLPDSGNLQRKHLEKMWPQPD